MSFDKPIQQNRGDADGSATFQALLLDAQSYQGPRAINLPSDNARELPPVRSETLDFGAHPVAGYDAGTGSTRLEREFVAPGDSRLDRRTPYETWHKSHHGVRDENEHLVNQLFGDDPDLGKVALRYLRDREGLDAYPKAADKNADILALQAYGKAKGFSLDIVDTLNNAADRFAKEDPALKPEHDH